MAEDDGMAFARLFSQRRDELDLSVVDIAVRTGRPIDIVVGWDRGTAVPDAADLAKVAETLRLPQPLLEEARRRVVEYRLGAPPLGPGVDASAHRDEGAGDEATSGDQTTATKTATATYVPSAHQPSTFSSNATPTVSTVSSAMSTVFSAMSTMFTDMRGSISRRRRLARAPIAHPSYMEDRDQLITYRLRLVFTAAGVAALALILRWSLGGLGSAIADLWEAMIGTL